MFKELALPDGRGLGLYDRASYAHNIGDRVPAQLPAGAVSPTELYFHVPDLGAAIAKLEAAGATELSARAVRPWGDEAAYYADPDGNVLVVATPTE
jgi:predicted enzyme related to lactoylglutathione lyase